MASLYVWTPDGFGELTFCVVAGSLELARQAVEVKVDEIRTRPGWEGEYSTKGWGTDYYKLTVCGVGEVFTHRND
jgi:hypothetical protein